MQLDSSKYRLSLLFDGTRDNAASTTCAASTETVVAARSEKDEATKGMPVAFSRDTAFCQLSFSKANDFFRLFQKATPPNASEKISVPILEKRLLFPTLYTKNHLLGVVAGDAKPQHTVTE